MENKREYKRQNAKLKKPSKSESSEGSEFVDDNSFNSEKFERDDEANQNKHGGSLQTT